MPTRPPYRQLSAQLSPEAYDGWRWFAGSQRIDLSALLEALGLMLHDVDEARPPALLRRAVRDAASIQVERKARRPAD